MVSSTYKVEKGWSMQCLYLISHYLTLAYGFISTEKIADFNWISLKLEFSHVFDLIKFTNIYFFTSVIDLSFSVLSLLWLFSNFYYNNNPEKKILIFSSLRINSFMKNKSNVRILIYTVTSHYPPKKGKNISGKKAILVTFGPSLREEVWHR